MIKDYLREKIDEKGWAVYRLHRISGVSASYINEILKGEIKEVSIGILKKLARAFNEDIELWLEAAGANLSVLNSLKINKNELRRIPILSSVQASHFREVVQAEHDEQTEYIYTDSKDRDAFAMRVHGDCMEPEFKEGEIVIINPNAQYDHNDFVLAMDRRDFHCTLKQFKNYGDGNLNLHPWNPKYDDIKIDRNIEIIGCVVAKTKRYKG